jgi:superfamily II DNA or RNA helicase
MSNFITNSPEGIALKDRIEKLVSRSKELKFLVGFFYFSGWQNIYKSLIENDNVILKVLVGLQVDRYLSDIIEVGNKDDSLSVEEHFTQFVKSLGNAINNAEMDNEEFYSQIEFFIKLLDDNRLIIKKTSDPNHAKVYVFKYIDSEVKFQNSRGIFITGSSNFTKAGLHGQNEFNVEIRDYGFDSAEKYFDNLWKTAIPISDEENNKRIIIDFLKNKAQTSLVTPYETYAYILKTYIELQENKRITPSLNSLMKENGFVDYKYQIDAVNQALNIIETYNGVIIADVVGLGKSVVASLIARQLGKRGLVLCPPGLIGDKHNNTGWWEYLNKFMLYNWDIESTGKIEEIAESMAKNDGGYEAIIVDEVHWFRNQDTSSYEALLNICRGKIIILLTATPFNNSPADIFSLLKLFIVPGQSGITIEHSLVNRFIVYNYRFRNLSYILKNHNSKKAKKRNKSDNLYIKMFDSQLPVDISRVKENAKQMANDIKNVISPVIIRRNRLDLKEDYEYKDEIANLSEINDPEELFYELTEKQSEFYDKIIKDYFGEDGKFKGAIYKPYQYEFNPKMKIGEKENREKMQQCNLYDFMRRLLVKRFESSFGSFHQSIERFLKTHEMVKSFIDSSGKYILDRKVIRSIYNDEDNADDFALESIKIMLEEFKNNAEHKTSPKQTKIYDISKFYHKDKFLNDIENDITLFKQIRDEVRNLNLVNDDPKRKKVLGKIKDILNVNENPKRKIVLFTEYTDTVKHLKDYFHNELNCRVLFCEGNITKSFRNKLEENFNAKYEKQKDDYDVLITSDKLSEGVNLNRAGLIINYDIPWNPTKVIQRIGRINRIGAKVFDKLYIYNFFPTERGADIVHSKQIASNKMFLIHNALGEDSKIFEPDEEPTASGLFNKINFNPDKDGEISISTKVRNEFERIKEEHPEVIKRIEGFPNRTKTAKAFIENNTIVLRKKGLSLFSMVGKRENKKIGIKEISFNKLFDYVKCNYSEPRLLLPKNFWGIYMKIKEYSPNYGSKQSALALEPKAINSLKTLLRQKDYSLNQEIVSFINTLLKDLKRYKTLPKFTVRKITLQEKDNKPRYDWLIKNTIKLKEEIGKDYLDNILKRTSNIDDDIIIAIENIKENKEC